MAPDVAYGVAGKLYSLIHQLPEGSEQAEIAEHAIGLALSPRRPRKDGPLFLHDVWRNGAHNFRRAERRRRALKRRLREASSQLTARGFRAPPDDEPEEVAVAADLEDRIRWTIVPLSPHSLRCLDGMLTGETVAETAAAVGVAPRTIDRTRRAIRDATQQLLAAS